MLYAFETLVFICLLVNSPSARLNALYMGLSAPRLVIGSFFLIAAVIFSGIGLALAISSDLHAQSHRWLSQPEKLLVVRLTLMVIFLCISIFTLWAALHQYNQILRRLAEWLIWLGLLSLQLWIFLQWHYRSIYQKPGFFADAPRKIARTLFLKHTCFWVGLVLLLLSAAILLTSSSISLSQIPRHDSGIFLYFGQQILNGKMPYLDLWDHKPPLIFYLDALGLAIGRGSSWGVWFLEFVSLALSSLIGFFALRRYYHSLSAAIAVCTSLAMLVFFLEGGNLTEEFSLPLQWGTLFLFTVSDRKGWQGPSGKVRAFLIGVFFSLALNLKQTMIGVWVALFFFLGVHSFFKKNWRDFWKVITWAAIGAITTMAIIISYFAFHRSLGEYWQVAFIYNFLYSDLRPNQRIDTELNALVFLISASPVFLLALLAWIFGTVRTIQALVQKKNRFPFPLIIALIDLPIEIVLISASGKNYAHYFMILLPSLAILIAWSVAGLCDLCKNLPRWAVAACMLVLVAVSYAPACARILDAIQPTHEETISDTVQFVMDETQPADYLLVWGSQTVVNYLSNRPAPTRFVHQKPLFRAGFANRKLSDELLRDLKTHAPKLIINTHLPSTPFIATSPGGACLLPPDPPDGMETVFQFICDHYVFDKNITKDEWEIYRLRKGNE